MLQRRRLIGRLAPLCFGFSFGPGNSGLGATAALAEQPTAPSSGIRTRNVVGSLYILYIFIYIFQCMDVTFTTVLLQIPVVVPTIQSNTHVTTSCFLAVLQRPLLLLFSIVFSSLMSCFIQDQSLTLFPV